MATAERYYNSFIDEQITIYLHRNDLTQAQFAGHFGMSENTFSWKRRGIREFKWSEIQGIAEVIGFSLDEAAERNQPICKLSSSEIKCSKQKVSVDRT